MPRQLVNVVGVIVVGAVLVAGILLVGMPVYFQSVATSAQAAAVSQANDIYQARVDLLNEEEERLDEITADVATLRTQIPAKPQTEDVFEIVGAAASAVGATVVSVTAMPPQPWVERTGSADQAAAAAESLDGDESQREDQDLTDTSGIQKQQVPISISLLLDDPSQAATFLDQLGMGPRLIAVTGSTMESSDGAHRLDVDALAFVETEG